MQLEIFNSNGEVFDSIKDLSNTIYLIKQSSLFWLQSSIIEFESPFWIRELSNWTTYLSS